MILTKIKMWATSLLVLGLFAAWYNTVGVNQASHDDNYVLSSKWDPPVLNTQTPALITVSVDGAPLSTRRRHLSPYQETMTAAKGALVTLTVTSADHHIIFMDCVIMRNGRSVPSGGFDTIGHAGTVKCVA